MNSQRDRTKGFVSVVSANKHGGRVQRGELHGDLNLDVNLKEATVAQKAISNMES
jgi:hypothetical protein